MAPKPIRSVPVGDDPSDRVHPDFVQGLHTKPSSGASTVYEIILNSIQKYPNEICFRNRKFLRMKSSRVKEFAPDPIELTYRQVGLMSHRFGAALRSKGMVPSQTITNLEKNTAPCRMAIFENTCPEWMIAMMGAMTQSVAVVTVYATLGIDAVGDSINDNTITTIVCNKTNVKTILEKAKDMPSLKVIVYTNDSIASDDISIELPSPPKGIEVFSFESFLNLGDTDAYPAMPPSPETTAVVMYTSGSTGKPKGVIMTHANVVAAVSNPDYIIDFSPRHRYLAYLPLAHILELVVELTMVMNGCSLNYADPRTLSSTGSYPTGAMEFYKPHVMVVCIFAPVNPFCIVLCCILTHIFLCRSFTFHFIFHTKGCAKNLGYDQKGCAGICQQDFSYRASLDQYRNRMAYFCDFEWIWHTSSKCYYLQIAEEECRRTSRTYVEWWRST